MDESRAKVHVISPIELANETQRVNETTLSFRVATSMTANHRPDEENQSIAREVIRKNWKNLSWWGSGIRADLRRRYPHYASDWRDGIYFGSLAAGLLLFFAQVAPGMSFGEAMASRTENQLGVIEALFATGLCSVIYALFAGQPLVVVGLTGPSTVLYGTMFLLSDKFDISFLPWMFWVCFWCFIFLLCLALANASNAIVFVTRFTAEGFEVLVAVTYLTEAVRQLIHISESGSLANIMGSLLLAIAVLYITLVLHDARKWPYGTAGLRELIAGYGVAVAVIGITGLSYIPLFRDAEVVRLSVPDTWNWTPLSGRDWIVPFWDVSVGAIFAAAIPGLLMALLYFFDTSVSAILTQQEEFNLKKGPSYHYDMIVQGIIVVICGILGLPAVNGLLPQSPLHVRALASLGYKDLPGGRKEEIYLFVRETRVAAMLHALLFFLVLCFLVLPASIPKGVFVGLFLYLGFTTFRGNSLIDRLKLLFVESELRAEHWTLLAGIPYKDTVKFTLTQALAVLITYMIGEHSGAVGVIFPLLIVLMIPFRWFIMPKYIPLEHLKALDNNFHGDANARELRMSENAETAVGVVETTSTSYSHVEDDVDHMLHHRRSRNVHDANFNRSRLLSGEWMDPLIQAELTHEGNFQSSIEGKARD